MEVQVKRAFKRYYIQKQADSAFNIYYILFLFSPLFQKISQLPGQDQQNGI